MKRKVILLDMDGVIADFVGAIFALHNQEPNYKAWPKGEYDCSKILGISRTKFWQLTDDSPTFWKDMPRLENGLALYELLKKEREVFIATSPSRDPKCSSGKIEWLQRHLGSNFRNFILSPHKHLMAASGILIDDDDERCQKFIDAGGQAIVYPQPWNSNHKHTNRQVEFTLEQLRTN